MSQASVPFNSASASWEDHRTAFFQALKANDRDTLETVLHKYPEAVDWKDAKGTPPLHTAFAQRDLDTFKFLLEKGADPNQQAQFAGLRAIFSSYPDPSILELSIKAGQKPYIIPLLQYNADQEDIRDHTYKPPRHIQFEIIDLLKRGGTIRKEFLAAPPAPAAQTPQAPASGNAATDIQVMKPAQVQRRTPNASA